MFFMVLCALLIFWSTSDALQRGGAKSLEKNVRPLIFFGILRENKGHVYKIVYVNKVIGESL